MHALSTKSVPSLEPRSMSGTNMERHGRGEGVRRDVRLLVTEFGTEVNVKNNDGWMPLHRPASLGYVDVVRLLISEFGAEVNLKTNDGRTPLDLTVNFDYDEIKEFLTAEINAKNEDRD